MGAFKQMSRGLRVARVCPKDDCNWREFGNPQAKCPEHGRGADQKNHWYFGRPTPTYKGGD